MIDEILISVTPAETRAALCSEGRMVELLVERADSEDIKGNVYLGRVRKVLPGLSAAFIDIGRDRAGFLPLAEGRAPRRGLSDQPTPNENVTEGGSLLVQVRKNGTGSKGPRLSARIGLPGRYLVLSPDESGLAFSRRITEETERARLADILGPIMEPSERFVCRTRAVGVEAQPLLDDAERLRSIHADVATVSATERAPSLVHPEEPLAQRVLRDHADAQTRRIVFDDRETLARTRTYCRAVLPEFEARLELHDETQPLLASQAMDTTIEAALSRLVSLRSGGTIVVERTEALIAIDVNTAQSTSGHSFDDKIVETNIEAAAEIGRQLRLRNLGGLIIVDFVHMDRLGDGERVVAALRAAVAADPMPVEASDMSPMGLVEMTRRRERSALAELFLEPCASCADGFVRSRLSVAIDALGAAYHEGRRSPGGTLTLVACPEVVDALDGVAAEARRRTEEALGRSISLRPMVDWGRDRYDILVASHPMDASSESNAEGKEGGDGDR